MRKSALSSFLALLVAGLALADVVSEGALSLGSFRLESPGIGGSGPVVITGNQTHDGIQSLMIEAFGKQFSLTTAQLQGLHGRYFNGMQLTYWPGDKELGGGMVYLTITLGFTRGVVERRFVVIREDGTISVGDKP